jgi:hypothetical protein
MNSTQSRRTPINDAYPTCLRTCASLHVDCGEVSPKEISLLLAIEPSERMEAGEIVTNSLGRSRKNPRNIWICSSEPHVDSKDLRRHLDWLLDTLEPSGQSLRTLQERRGLTMTVNCIWWSAYGQGGPTLWPEQMIRLGSLNLECTFDVAYQIAADTA